MISSKL